MASNSCLPYGMRNAHNPARIIDSGASISYLRPVSAITGSVMQIALMRQPLNILRYQLPRSMASSWLKSSTLYSIKLHRALGPDDTVRTSLDPPCS